MEVVAAPGEPPIIPWKGFDTCDRPKTERLANSRFIAAANPAVVLELVRRLREAEARVLMAVKAERDAIIQQIPGGSIVDPQWVCDMIRSRGTNQPPKGGG